MTHPPHPESDHDGLRRLVLVPLERETDRVAGRYARRRTVDSMQVATGTLACPACDAPVWPGPEPMSPADSIFCGFCSESGAVRDFLSLGEPTRPARVAVRLRLR